MTKEEIINYVMNTPENTNPAVLKSMLEEIESGSSSSSDDEMHTYTAASLATFPTGALKDLVTEKGVLYGSFDATISVAGFPYEHQTIPVEFSLQGNSLAVKGGGPASGMRLIIHLTGAGSTGLTASIFYLINGKNLMDVTSDSNAGSIVSNILVSIAQ